MRSENKEVFLLLQGRSGSKDFLVLGMGIGERYE